MMRPLIFTLGLMLSSAGNAAVAQTLASGPQLGKTFGGEACRAGDDLSAARPTDIYCGSASQSVGLLEVGAVAENMPQDLAGRREAIVAHARSLADTLALREQLSCDAGQFAGGSDILLFFCTMQSTGWPRVLLISGAGRSVVQAEGIPSARGM
jgi:hypothetical protein